MLSQIGKVTPLIRKLPAKAFSSKRMPVQGEDINQLRQIYHESQIDQLNSSLTLVDKEDNVVGSISKAEGHLRSNISHPEAFPHRAFSLFLFNSKFELLLQQRSPNKITFPRMWTNTCCSHNSHIDRELEQEPNYIGMRRAAIRRTYFELGIKDLDEEDEHVVSRILYYANACDKFAEFELDYIIFAQKDIAEFHANEDEVMDTRYVGLEELDSFIEERKRLHNEDITPWFQLLLDNKLKKWWYNYREKGQLPNEAHYIENFI